MEKYLGIDLGGTNIKAAVVNKEGGIFGSASFKTHARRGPEAPAGQLILAAEKAMAAAGVEASEVSAAGIGIPGNAAWPRGEVIFCPNLAWKRFDLISRLESKLNIKFSMGNDADCMALAESRFGAGREYRSFMLITLGTGVGGSIINEGRVFRGFGDCGGEFGCTPLVHGGYESKSSMNGCLEEYCSIRGMKRLASEEGLPFGTGPMDVFALAKSGDAAAQRTLERYTQLLSEALAGFVNIFRPDAILIGGGISRAGEALFGRLNSKLSRLTYACDCVPAPPVLPAALGPYSGAVGAALLVME